MFAFFLKDSKTHKSFMSNDGDDRRERVFKLYFNGAASDRFQAVISFDS